MYAYTTYGTRTVSDDSYANENLEIMGYCGRDGVLTDPNSLNYMRARYYSSVIRRFISEDVVTGDIANSNSLKRYTYVEGNPVTMVDPFGL